MKTRIHKILLSTLFLISSHCYASHSIPCDSCHMSTEARIIADTRNPGETFTIIDTVTYAAKSYRTELIHIGGEPFVVAREIPLTPQGRSDSDRLRGLFFAAQRIDVEIPKDLPGTSVEENIISAHDLILTPGIRGPLGRHVADNINVFTQLGAVGGLILEIFGEITKINVVVNVRFSDGSTATFDLTGIDSSSLEFTYLEGTAKDSEGQTIPDDINEFAGRFVFDSEQNQNRFSSIAQLFDIIMRDEPVCTFRFEVICSETGGQRICISTRSCR